jgi:hypothetical protein
LRLTEIFRQAAQSRIITGAHKINQGLIPDLSKPEGDSDFYFVQADDPEPVSARSAPINLNQSSQGLVARLSSPPEPHNITGKVRRSNRVLARLRGFALENADLEIFCLAK